MLLNSKYQHYALFKILLNINIILYTVHNMAKYHHYTLLKILFTITVMYMYNVKYTVFSKITIIHG